MLIPDRGDSSVMYIAYRAPTKYGVYLANVSRLDTTKIVVIKINEIASSPTNAIALPYTPGAVTAYRTAS